MGGCELPRKRFCQHALGSGDLFRRFGAKLEKFNPVGQGPRTNYLAPGANLLLRKLMSTCSKQAAELSLCLRELRCAIEKVTGGSSRFDGRHSFQDIEGHSRNPN
jgi:hypothetical protein